MTIHDELSAIESTYNIRFRYHIELFIVTLDEIRNYNKGNGQGTKAMIEFCRILDKYNYLCRVEVFRFAAADTEKQAQLNNWYFSFGFKQCVPGNERVMWRVPTQEKIQTAAESYAEQNNDCYTNDMYGFIEGVRWIIGTPQTAPQ